jgi:Fe-S oxidoreductase
VYRCPSYSKYYFSKVAYGRMKLGLALTEERLHDTPGMQDMVFQCLMCGSCDSGCKRNLDLEIMNSLEALRSYMVEKGRYPEAHNRIIKNIETNHNRFGAPHKDRSKGMPAGANDNADIVFFVGCAASYREKEIADSAGRILNALGSYMLIPDEQCCGHPLFAMGHFDAFRKQMAANFEAMKKTGARKLVTACAECYKTWKVDYPRMMKMNTTDLPFEVVHISELVAQNLEDGFLELPGKVDLKVAWHDPCNLGRMSEPYTHWEGARGQWGCLESEKGYGDKEFRRGTSGVYDEPRYILATVPGIELLELKRHHEFSWCCGGHAGVPEAYPELTAHSVSERLEEVSFSGAEGIVSACPYCKETLKKGIKEQNRQIQVFDITEVIAEAL